MFEAVNRDEGAVLRAKLALCIKTRARGTEAGVALPTVLRPMTSCDCNPHWRLPYPLTQRSSDAQPPHPPWRSFWPG